VDDATKKWEKGARARLMGEPLGRGADAQGAMAVNSWRRDKEAKRLTALWLEHRASELDAKAEAALEIGDHLGAERLARGLVAVAMERGHGKEKG
jgi:hypothetical protein